MMPVEMLSQYLGKKCTISLLGSIGAYTGTILEIEENWVKLEEKKLIRIINGDTIRDITLTK